MNPTAEHQPVLRHRLHRLLAALVTASLAAWLPGCGGGSGGVDSGGTGIAPQTLAVGPISGFGSIVVGGVHYEETAAQVVDADGSALPASSLALGMMTSIDASAVTTSTTTGGTRQDAQAQTIRVSETLVGPVASVNPTASTLLLLGQTVLVNANTVFDSSLAAGLSALTAGQVVAVHGQLDVASGRTVATRIEPRGNATAYVVRGTLSSLDRTAQRLAVGSLVVSLAEVASVPAELNVGSVVRLKLRTSASAGVWTATALRADGLRLPDRDNVELEGRVTAFTSAQQFSVDGVAVDASAATISGAVALGVRLEVEGRSSGGVLVARKVSREDEEGGNSQGIELEGRITAVDAAARTFVVRGITVQWSDSTVFLSSAATDLVLNRAVAVKGRLAADRSRVEASSIHVEL